MWCIFLMHFIIYVRKLRRVAHRCVLHVFCALPPPTRRMCTLKFQLNDVHGLIFYLSVFCFITSTGTLLYYLHLNICNDLKCYTCVIPLPVIALLIVFLSDACHFEKIKPWCLSLGVKSIPLGRIARYFPIPSRMQQKMKYQGSPFKGVTGGIIRAISWPA